ncbi:MAG: bifunctional hydroxymethylpyrimidine kinase/phosphomethylpyrimidine kinase [Sulfolobus sp.]
MYTRPVVLTIAGSDSGGGAGLQADLKTFTSLGVFGTVVVTGLTAQNTKGVFKVLEIPLDFIEAQFDVIMDDLKPEFAKTGMLANSSIVELVEKKVKQYNLKLVLDPVMVAKSGDPLVTEDTVKALQKLMRVSLITTPNKFEAEKIAGFKITNLNELAKSAKVIYDKYGVNVVVKGGSSLNGTDVAIIDGDEIILKGESINTKNTHGSGDVFSASLTAYLAKGYKLKDAVKLAKEYVTLSIKYSLSLGGGHGPVDPFAPAERIIERENARAIIEKILWEIERDPSLLKSILDEEDKSNIAVMTKYGDIATVAGGVINYLDKIKIDGPILINIDNTVSRVNKKFGKKIVISASFNKKLLEAAEKGVIKLTQSGENGDVIVYNGRAYITANDEEELIKKLKLISS